MAFPFARHVSERGHGHPDGFPVQQVELKNRTLCVCVSIIIELTPLSVWSLSKIAHIYRLIERLLFLGLLKSSTRSKREAMWGNERTLVQRAQVAQKNLFPAIVNSAMQSHI